MRWLSYLCMVSLALIAQLVRAEDIEDLSSNANLIIAENINVQVMDMEKLFFSPSATEKKTDIAIFTLDTFPPTAEPTEEVIRPPSPSPTEVPTFMPTVAPTTIPTALPSAVPSLVPTKEPTVAPTEEVPVTSEPSVFPTEEPSFFPTLQPSFTLTHGPSMEPTEEPSATPSTVPTAVPSQLPSASPSPVPTIVPTAAPTAVPSFSPSAIPTAVPSFLPTASPTFAPSAIPSAVPTFSPSLSPSTTPTAMPTAVPSVAPTFAPTASPSVAPSATPTAAPTASPSQAPSPAPTPAPSLSPSAAPTASPTAIPTRGPTAAPTFSPSAFPTFPAPTPAPTPTSAPTPTKARPPPTRMPTESPTLAPTYQSQPVVTIGAQLTCQGTSGTDLTEEDELAVRRGLWQRLRETTLPDLKLNQVQIVGVEEVESRRSLTQYAPEDSHSDDKSSNGRARRTVVEIFAGGAYTLRVYCEIVLPIVDFPQYASNVTALTTTVSTTIANSVTDGTLLKTIVALSANESTVLFGVSDLSVVVVKTVMLPPTFAPTFSPSPILTTKETAGVSVAVLFFVVLCTGGVYLCLVKRRKHKQWLVSAVPSKLITQKQLKRKTSQRELREAAKSFMTTTITSDDDGFANFDDAIVDSRTIAICIAPPGVEDLDHAAIYEENDYGLSTQFDMKAIFGDALATIHEEDEIDR